MIDALEPPGSAGRAAPGGSLSSPAIAALDRLRRNGSPGEAGAWLARAEEAFERLLGPPAAGRLRDGRELLEAAARWERAAGRIARLNGWRPPDAVRYLESLLAGELEGQRRGDRRRPPRHLGYFVRPLLAEARRNERRAREREPAERRRGAAAAANELIAAALRAGHPDLSGQAAANVTNPQPSGPEGPPHHARTIELRRDPGRDHQRPDNPGCAR